MTRTPFSITIPALVVLLLGSIGCEDRNASSTSTSVAAPAAIPAAFFTSRRPAEVTDLAKVKPTAKKGDAVTFLARVGGRSEPFVNGQAIFTVADPTLLSCELMGEEDHCPVPWDYCCENPNGLRFGSATVRLVGDDDLPLRASAQGAGGLAPARYVVVDGVVADRNDQGLFVVDAKRIWVGGRPVRGQPRAGSMAGEESLNVPAHDHDFDGIPDHDHDHHHGHGHDHDHDHG